MKRPKLCAPALVLGGLGAVLPAAAQSPCPSGWQTTAGEYGLAGRVQVTVGLADGRYVVGGLFTGIGTSDAKNLAAYDPVTGVWSSLGISPNDRVECLTMLNADELFVGGAFTSIGGVAARSAAIYNVHTGVWTSLGSFPGGSALAALQLPGGDVLVGGSFGVYRRSRITNTWSALGLGVRMSSPPFAGLVTDLDDLPDGRVLVAGRFTMADTVPAANVAAWDPATSTWAAHANGLDLAGSSIAQINSVVVLPNGDMLAGGHRRPSGPLSSGIARFDHTAGLWSALPASVAISSVGWINSMALLPDGDVVIGGVFTNVGSLTVSGVARLDLDTMTPATLGTNSQATNVDDVCAVGTSVLVAGLISVNQTGRPLGLFDTVTSSWQPIAPRAPGQFNATARLSDGRIFVGGSFTIGGSVGATNCAIYNPVTLEWQAAGTGVDGPVNAVEVLADGSVLAGGTFANAEGSPARGIARYFPATNTWSAVGGVSLSAGASINAIRETANGDVLIGGGFGVSSGPPAPNFALYSTATDTLAALPPGTNGSVNAIELGADGAAVLGGSFTSAGGVPAARVARYTPSTGTWSALGAGLSGTVRAVRPMNDGRVLASLSGTTNTVNIFDPSTGAWATIPGGPNGQVLSMLAEETGDVLMGGTFATVNGAASTGITRFTPSDSLWSVVSGVLVNAAASPTTPRVASLLADAHGYFAAGSFTSAGGEATMPLVRWIERCLADHDCDFEVDGDDVISFFGAWDAGENTGDVNGDGGTDSDDVITFFGAWDSGC